MKSSQTNAPQIWDQVWQAQNVSGAQLQWNLERDLSIMRWGMFQKFIEEELGTLVGLKSIELGAGRGTASLQLALAGVQVTLVDWSDQALETAANLYGEFGLLPKLVKANILDLPSSLFENFDISLSIGVGEHFMGAERSEVIRSHSNVLHQGGVSLISVPNRACLPYRVAKLIAEKRGRWRFGLELPFTRTELTHLATKNSLEPRQIIGSSFLESVNHFLIRGYGATIWKRITGHTPQSLKPECDLGQVPERIWKEQENTLDRYFGYLLNLMGRRI